MYNQRFRHETEYQNIPSGQCGYSIDFTGSTKIKKGGQSTAFLFIPFLLHHKFGKENRYTGTSVHAIPLPYYI